MSSEILPPFAWWYFGWHFGKMGGNAKKENVMLESTDWIYYHFFVWPGRWFVLAAIVALAVTPIIVAVIRQRRRRQAVTETRRRNYEKWAAWVESNRRLPTMRTDLMLDGGEIVHHCETATLVEPRAVRVSNHGGIGYNVGGGIMIGGGRSVSESHDEWRVLSRGVVYVTSRRVIFDGEKHNRAIGISSILSVQSEPNAVMITAAGRQKTMMIADANGLIIHAAIQHIRNGFQVSAEGGR
jgi:hypothetical protein